VAVWVDSAQVPYGFRDALRLANSWRMTLDFEPQPYREQSDDKHLNKKSCNDARSSAAIGLLVFYVSYFRAQLSSSPEHL
jgi:hypothetical protein